MSITSNWVLVVILFFISIPIMAAQPTHENELNAGEGLDTLIPPLLDAYAVPGVAIGLLKNGVVVKARGYGHTNIQTGKHVSPTTLFNVGSISKSVTALGVMQLVGDGKLDLDVPVNSYLKRWRITSKEFNANDVTVRRLLNHTAGLSMWGVPDYPPNQKVPSLEEMLRATTDGAKDIKLTFQPGTEWRYSGGGYAVLQLLIEDISKRSFAGYMNEHVLIPLGMKDSSFVWNPKTIKHSATPYDASGKAFSGQRFTATAAAGLQTTLSDLLRFALTSMGDTELLHSLNVDLDAIRLMQATTEVSPEYGLGYELTSNIRGLQFVGHSGQNEGWMSLLLVSPATKDGIVILTNGTNGLRIISEVKCAWLISQYNDGCEGVTELPIQLSESKLLRFSGRYKDDSGSAIRLNVHSGQLFWETDYGYEFALRPSSKQEFYWVVGTNHLTFKFNEKGSPTTMLLHQKKEVTTFQRVN